MFLYANGCSMTFGAELMGNDDKLVKADSAMNQERIRMAWPGVLTEMMGWSDHFNDGTPHSSNTTIVDRTIAWLTMWLSQKHDLNSLFVIINWSHPHRYALPCRGRWITISPENDPSPKLDKEIRRIWYDYSTIMFNSAHDWYNFFQQVLLLQQFFIRHGIVNYLMTTALESPNQRIDEVRNATGFGAIDSIINMIDMNRLLGVYESDSAMLEWLHARGYDNFAPMGHPREDGHVLWAGHVSKRIKELL